MINFKTIGQRIKIERKQNGLTQEKLAEMLKISTEHLSRIESGSYRPSLSLIENMSEIFKISESEIMFGKESEFTANKSLAERIENLTDDKKQAIMIIIDLISK